MRADGLQLLVGVLLLAVSVGAVFTPWHGMGVVGALLVLDFITDHRGIKP